MTTNINDLTARDPADIADPNDISLLIDDLQGTPATYRLTLDDLLWAPVDVINVKAYGAAGDGIADDTDEIQAAMDACQTKSDSIGVPVPVVFPAGKYYVTDTITLPQQSGSFDTKTNPRWLCSGYGAQIFTDENVPIFEALGPGTYNHDYWVPTFEGFDFLGDHDWQTNVRTGQYGILWHDAYSLAIRDCTFRNLTYGYFGDFTLNAKIEACRFHDCKFGVFFTGGGTMQSIDTCRIYMTDPEGVAVTGSSLHAINTIVEGFRCKYAFHLGVYGSATAYSAGTTYAVDDTVSYGGLVYTSLQASNTGNTPDSSPTWWTSGAGTAQHGLLDHCHVELDDNCLYLFKVSGDRDFGFNARDTHVAVGEYLLLDGDGSDDGTSFIIDGIRGTEPGIDDYAAGTTYGQGDRAIYSGNVYRSLQASNTGNTPSSSPTYWADEGDGTICRGPQTAHYRLKDVISTSVRDWTPENFWMDSTEWNNGLPRFLEYDGFNGINNAGMIHVRSYEDDGALPNGDSTPDVTGRQWWKTGNTGATDIEDFDFQGTYEYFRSESPLTIHVGDANTTFKHQSGGSSTKLNLLGGVDYAASTNDVLTFVRVAAAGPWVQIGGNQ